MIAAICASCGTATSNLCNLCDDCVTTRAHTERVAQGLDPIERDPARAARLAQRLAHNTKAAS